MPRMLGVPSSKHSSRKLKWRFVESDHSDECMRLLLLVEIFGESVDLSVRIRRPHWDTYNELVIEVLRKT